MGVQVGERDALKSSVPLDRIRHELSIPEIQVVSPELRLQSLGGSLETAFHFRFVVRIHVVGLEIKESIHEGRFQVAE